LVARHPISRKDLTNQQWQRLQPLLPKPSSKGGRPAYDHRTVINGILWILRTGSPWRDLPGRYGAWETVSGRFYAWRKRGLWQKILEQLQQQTDAAGEFDWKLHFVDGSVIRAHQHAAGARGGDAESEALRYSQGGFSTKMHLRCEGKGKPVTFLLTVGERHESVMFEALMEQGEVKREGRGRLRIRPQRVAGDKAYTGDRFASTCIAVGLERWFLDGRMSLAKEHDLTGRRIESAIGLSEQSTAWSSFDALPPATRNAQRTI
jgi:transposase